MANLRGAIPVDRDGRPLVRGTSVTWRTELAWAWSAASARVEILSPAGRSTGGRTRGRPGSVGARTSTLAQTGGRKCGRRTVGSVPMLTGGDQPI